MARLQQITGAIRGEDFTLSFVVKDDGVAVDVSDRHLLMEVHTPTVIRKTHESNLVSMGSNGVVSIDFDGGSEFPPSLRPGAYDTKIMLGLDDNSDDLIEVFDGQFRVDAS